MRLSLPLAAFALLALPAVAQTTPPAPAGAPPSAPTQAPAASTTAPEAAPRHGHARHGYLTLDKRFQMANTTHDGHLTLDQARSADVMHAVADNFEAIDKGHKGYVTEDDIRAWYKARRAARHHAAEEASKS